MISYGISVTYDCNWYCPYCLADTHSKKRDFGEVMFLAHSIPSNVKVTLSGGEPGMLETEQLHRIIGVLKAKGCSVSISSNGMIFSHPSIVEQVEHISYHCSMNMELTDEVNREYPDKTVYMVVVTDKNMHNLEAFLDKHNDLSIYVYAAESNKGDTLSTSNALKIAVKFKDRLPSGNSKYLLGREYQQEIEVL